MKTKLISKLMEKIRDLEPEEGLELVGLDSFSVIEDAIEKKLEAMTEDQILELL